MSTNQAIFDSSRKIAFGSLTNAFQLMGSVLATPAHAIILKNSTDTVLQFSIDGTNVTWELPANSYDSWDISTNHKILSEFLLAANTGIYVRYLTTPPTLGSAVVEVLRGTT